MLGAFLELGERCDRIASLGVLRIVDLQEDRAIPLDDEWIGGIVLHELLARRGLPKRAVPAQSGLVTARG